MNNMLGEIKPEDGCEDKEEGKEVEVAVICDSNKNNQEYFKLNNLKKKLFQLNVFLKMM